MRTDSLALWTVVIVLMAYIALNQNGQNTPSPESAELKTEAAVLAEGGVTEQEPFRTVRILRQMKLPAESPTGEFCFNDEQDFKVFLGPRNLRFVRWNNVDFRVQSVLIVSKVYCCARPPLQLRSVLSYPSGIVVQIEEENGSVTLPQQCWQCVVGVVVPKIRGPVRYEWKVGARVKPL